MNQYVLFNFSLVKNDRIFQFSVQPGAPWEDVEAILDEFKVNVIRLKEEAIAKEAEKNSSSAAPEPQEKN